MLNSDFLKEQVNENETTLQFIRNSEEEFGLKAQALECFSIENLKEYVGFLDLLWDK